MNTLAGISESNRRLLTTVHRHTSGLVDVEEAARLLKLDRTKTAKLLAQWAAQGWARRLLRGLYELIPLEATSPENWTEDPWLVAARLFAPGYIAGWSACEHWGLTEQIFRDVAVFTARPLRQRALTVDQTTFVLRKVSKRLLFGLISVWRKSVAVQVSDPSRTIIDVLDQPRWGGGLRHVSQVLDAYLASAHRHEELLIEYVGRLGNAAVAKRLGYLWEVKVGTDAGLLEPLREQLTTGIALLDPTVEARGPIVTRWNLRVNVDIHLNDTAD
jgi:predicted transcriptional regulator of viral defense system